VRAHGVLGLAVAPGPPYLVQEVYELMDETGAVDNARVVAGDEVVAVDGAAVAGRDPEEVFPLLVGPPGTLVDITLRRAARAGAEYTVTVQRHVAIDPAHAPPDDTVEDDDSSGEEGAESGAGGPGAQGAIVWGDGHSVASDELLI